MKYNIISNNCQPIQNIFIREYNLSLKKIHNLDTFNDFNNLLNIVEYVYINYTCYYLFAQVLYMYNEYNDGVRKQKTGKIESIEKESSQL